MQIDVSDVFRVQVVAHTFFSSELCNMARDMCLSNRSDSRAHGLLYSRGGFLGEAARRLKAGVSRSV